MNKDEILQKSRNENQDEGMLVAKNKGAQLGKKLMAIMAIIIIILTCIFEKGRISIGAMVVFAVVYFFQVGENIELYRFTKKKSDLAAIIVYTLVSLIWLVLFIVDSVFLNG